MADDKKEDIDIDVNYEERKKESDAAIARIRALDPSFDMAYKLGTLQAKAKFAVLYLRMGAENCKNKYIRKMIREEANSLRKFLVEECNMDIPFDPRYDV